MDTIQHQAFFKHVKRSDHTVFMANINGRAIGMCVTQLIDDGATFVTKSLRVHPQYKRQGYAKIILLYCERDP